MRRRFLGALVLLLTVSGLAGARTAVASGPEQAVDAFQAALAAGDRDSALGWLAPDIVIFESGGAELSRDEYARHHLAGDIEFVGATRTERVDRRTDAQGDLAWVLTRTKTSGTFRGKEVRTSSTETAILRRSEAGWRIIHLHWSSHAVR